jgi:mono/diheme cytochrome c family protein
MPSLGHLSSAFALFTLSLSLTGLVRAAEPYEAFIQKHCARCHGPDKEKGDLRLDKLSRDFKLGADTHHWAEAMERAEQRGQAVPCPLAHPAVVSVAK